jgi:hypothetical protein
MATSEAALTSRQVEAEGGTAIAGVAPAPDGFARNADVPGLRISWRDPRYRILTISGTLGLVLGGASFLYLPQRVPTPAALALAILLLAVSVYVLLVGLFNRTIISARRNQFAIMHRPLPCLWPLCLPLQRTRNLPPVDILKAWIEEGSRGHSLVRREPRYSLAVMTIGHGQLILLGRLRLAEAQYLQRQISEQMGVED